LPILFSSPKRPEWLWGQPNLFSGYWGFLLLKRPESEADHSPPSGEVNNEWRYIPAIARVFTACAGTTLPFANV
jgi:hypothetical protein